jgi:hypothetical protein
MLQYPSAEFWKTSPTVARYREKCGFNFVPLQIRLKFQFIDAVLRGDHTTAMVLLERLVKAFKQSEIGPAMARTAAIEALRSGKPQLADTVNDCFIKGNQELTGYEKLLYFKLADALHKRKP